MRKVLLLFLICVLFQKINAQNFDINLLKSINNNRNKSLDKGFQFLSNSVSPISISTPILLYTAGIIHSDKTIKGKALYIGEATIAAAIISTGLKYSIDRQRPFEKYPNVIDKASDAGSPSFPSGHTSSAFSTATSLSIAFPKWYIIVPSYAWASSVAYSRMHLGVHYPSDVLAGAIIGTGSAYLTHYINKKLLNKRK